MEISKEDKRVAENLIRRGILHRHAQWQEELRKLLDTPLDEKCNEYDRSMQITDKACKFYTCKFYKEAMEMEDYHRPSMVLTGLANLYYRKHITDEDLSGLSDEVKQAITVLLSR